MKGTCTFVIILIVLVAQAGLISAQTQNETQDNLRAAGENIAEMDRSGLPTERVKDLLEEAENLFEAQKALETIGGEPDYSFVLLKTGEISSIRDKAFQAKDEIGALEAALPELEGIDLAPVNDILSKAKESFGAGRFEEAIQRVDEAYERISELQSTTTRVTALLDAWGASIIDFLYENWLLLVVAAIAIIVIVIVFGGRIGVYLLKKMIERLNREKDVIRDITKDSQEKYFGGQMAESVYYVKMNKYGELTREINRKITVFESKLRKEEVGRKVEEGIKSLTRQKEEELKKKMDKARKEAERKTEHKAEKGAKHVEGKITKAIKKKTGPGEGRKEMLKKKGRKYRIK